MMSRKKRRLWIVIACGIGLSTAVALMLFAFRSSLSFFMSPEQVAARHPPPGRVFRLGGIVQANTVVMGTRNGAPYTTFRITDGRASIPVVYTGVLPGLFRQGQGVVTIGAMAKGDSEFMASTVLAKHGADYMPRDVEMALRKAGKWNPKFGPPPNAGAWDDKSPAQIEASNNG
ncbi:MULTISPECIES: cytochrome c maturation protein CcmE [Acidiphilium]|jgi:cytochrome c-type biogenesis protein CcmE|uniref:Cytochrome c-type biogenesis protein CcmE n=2 Tax=Acidiphilium TaxID=522 RepID=CCME_ACICJ|nr:MULTISPECIES: cytochrome c maturation protein CcmE [Acidiphilium]A5G2G1.1 RecName: Full=Cytochrome c-type biogenesis protein CcmE; AltName: Full=Cytochrome c maturation protein E; AltName: Full=Heme chaperone CcmE [Acidiphilium cryptum JF-5]MBU6356081.1 cytochrome c maturation protein CcmE [Rhodospirillales bacterium]ABQ32043.1 CcmE/CycJ protein [Acidiphilium cryptum JF-5]EGO96253.1 Cytochrome c-type biogenesis protein ccmE [Acidiphilium sp. PM]KDM68076.1 cytochrome c-type biogenesis protei